MYISTLFIKEPRDWVTLTNAVKVLTRNLASEVRYVGGVENLSDAESVVDVVVMRLSGAADYALEIYWKGMMALANDAVGMYLANALGSSVIVPDDGPRPHTSLLLSPNGIIENIELDVAQLHEHSTVSYKIA